ncbi:uncharacterized protein LOC132106067 [Carassius carassius]|uniref:uncharacterized protein LOC132106067 n=1 Tax=Carassius carassius TaxID=217509 RepID=UPI0028690E20|nr:uncharacterized protein LOC132106067 [Carassius carassius]
MAQRGPYKKYLLDVETEMPATTKRRRLQAKDAQTIHGDICSEMESQEPANSENFEVLPETEHEQYTDSAEIEDVNEYPEAEPEESNNYFDHERTNSSDEESEEVDDPQNAEWSSDVNSQTAPKDPLHLDDGDEPIYPGSDVTKAETILMILTFVLRHKISGEGMKDFLSLLHILFPSILPATKYLFDKYFLSITNQFEIHFYCESCKGYICKEVTVLTKCPHCDLPFDIASNLKSGSFMIYLPLSSSLKDVLESLKKNSQQLINKAEWEWDDTIRDIFDGDVMREHIQNKTTGPWDLTLLWNCDGIPVFESSQCSLWPIQVTINELPPAMRKEHILLSSLWFGKSKPVIDTFLKPFVEEMEVLKETGLQWIDGDEIRTSRIFAVVSACDAVARPMLKDSTQFNGKYGCDWCLHPGERVE